MSKLSQTLGHVFGKAFGGQEDAPTDPLAPVPGAELSGISGLGEQCSCELPGKSLKAMQAEDEEYVKNMDEYTWEGLKERKIQGEKIASSGFLGSLYNRLMSAVGHGEQSPQKDFDDSFQRVLAEKDKIDSAVKKLRQAFSSLSIHKRALEHAQERAAYLHYSRCRKFHDDYGMFLPCEETYRETMEAYRDAHQDASCAVGASLPLKPAALFPIDCDSQTACSMAVSAVAFSMHQRARRDLRYGCDFL